LTTHADWALANHDHRLSPSFPHSLRVEQALRGSPEIQHDIPTGRIRAVTADRRHQAMSNVETIFWSTRNLFNLG